MREQNLTRNCAGVLDQKQVHFSYSQLYCGGIIGILLEVLSSSIEMDTDEPITLSEVNQISN